MIHQVIHKILLILTTIYVIWMLIHLCHMMMTTPSKVSHKSFPTQIANPFVRSSPHTEESDNAYNSWLEDRANVYSQRRDRVRAVCDSYKGIHNPKEGKRFIFDIQNGVAFCMNMKVRLSLNFVICN